MKSMGSIKQFTRAVKTNFTSSNFSTTNYTHKSSTPNFESKFQPWLQLRSRGSKVIAENPFSLGTCWE